jgi:hypothetical protein
MAKLKHRRPAEPMDDPNIGESVVVRVEHPAPKPPHGALAPQPAE